LIAIFGPTGVGKTEIAVELADLLRARGEDPVAVSADAIAVYEGLDVLAAKPATDRLEHRLVSCVPIEEEFSAGRFAELAHAEIDQLLAEGRTPIVVGGTGLYLRAALTELDLRPPVEADLRAGLERELAEVGPAALHDRLSPATAAAVHPNDRKRIVRALELEQTGTAPHPVSDQLWSEELRRPTALFGIVMDRDALGARIEARVGEMLAGGAVEEVERALERGASRTARKALGFKEIAAHLAGEGSLDDVRERIERGHRAYVRRQLTWMRKLSGVETIDRTGRSAGEVAERIAS
jgi:tRNA dimethylallyltransferase